MKSNIHEKDRVSAMDGSTFRGSEQGFTVLELMIGMSVSAIALFVLTSLNSSTQNQIQNDTLVAARDEIAIRIDRALGSDVGWHKTVEKSGSSSTLMICVAGAIKQSDMSTPVYLCPDSGYIPSPGTPNPNPQLLPLEIYDGNGDLLSGKGGVSGATSPDDVDHPAYYDINGAPNCVISGSHTCPIQVVSYFRPRCGDFLYTWTGPPSSNPQMAQGATTRQCSSAEYIEVFYRVKVSSPSVTNGSVYFQTLTGYAIKTSFDNQLNPNPYFSQVPVNVP